MKSRISAIFVILISLFLLLNPIRIEANTPSGFFPIGTTFRYSNRNVYFVNNAQQFRAIANDSSGIYLIMRDIDMNGTHVEGLSTFSGSIHGFGHSISNMRYDGDQLIASSNSGHVEWVNFDNILVDASNGSSSSGWLFSTNNGDIENITYSIRNTTQSSFIPPLVSSNNDIIDNVVGNYDITADVDSNFFLYTALSDTNDYVTDYWIRGNVNVSTSGIFYYRSIGEGCVDALDVNVNTASSINSSYGSRCDLSSEESEFIYNGNQLELNYDIKLENDTAIVSYYRPYSGWNLWSFGSSTMTLNETSSYNLAGEHRTTINLDGSSLTLPLYQPPVFNSEQLNYEDFSSINQGNFFQNFSEEVSYSTNYSRVLINGEEASRSQTIQQFGDINLRLESDYNLPALEIDFRIYPELNFSDNQQVPIGFIPTTSIGFLTENEVFLFQDEPLDKEGETTLEVNYGDEILEFDITVFPLVEGVNPGREYQESVIPIITAASVTINGEDYDSPETFSQVGRYDVAFPNLPSQNFTFFIGPDYGFNLIDNGLIYETFEIFNNFDNLTVNGITFDEQFIISNASLMVTTGPVIEMRLGYGQHTIEISGKNDFLRTITRNNSATYNVETNPLTNEVTIDVKGAELFIDDVFETSSIANLENIGFYDVLIKYPEDIFSLSAGSTLYNNIITIEPIFNTLINGRTYNGSITPDVYAPGAEITLNNGPFISLNELNQTITVPGQYEIDISGKDGYERTLVFSVRVIGNIDQTTYYGPLDIELSSPENLIEYSHPQGLYPDEVLTFGAIANVRKPGEYQISYIDNRDREILRYNFVILPYQRSIENTNSELVVTITQLHPDVELTINNAQYNSPSQTIRYDAAGRYNVAFKSNVDDVIYEETSHLVFPQFVTPIAEETNQVMRYEITNDFEEFYLNGRKIENEVFLETQQFSINQNGENEIRIVGVNQEVFSYTSFFNNPHYNNVIRLSWYAVATGVIGVIAIVGRYILAVRREN